jgi:hypothetical protein
MYLCIKLSYAFLLINPLSDPANIHSFLLSFLHESNFFIVCICKNGNFSSNPILFYGFQSSSSVHLFQQKIIFQEVEKIFFVNLHR